MVYFSLWASHLLSGIGNDNLPVPFGYFSSTAYGFAYDLENDDYKVVRVVTHRETLRHICITTRAHIYSSKSNSWRLIDEKFTYPAVKHWRTHVNGALHTLLTAYTSPEDTGHTITMAFSVKSEKHYEAKMPPGRSNESDAVKALHNIGGCLSLIYNGCESGTEIWVIKEYGVRKSWTKMLSLPFCLTLAELDDGYMKPLAHTKDGNKVMFHTGLANTFVWHNLRNVADVKPVPVNGIPPMLDYFEGSVESLVFLHGEKQVQRQGRQHGDQDKKKDKKEIRKKRFS